MTNKLFQQAEVAHGVGETFSVGWFDFGQWQTYTAAAEAHEFNSLLDWNWVDFAEERVDEVHSVELDLCRAGNITVEVFLNHVMGLLWCDVGEHRDDALAAEGKDRHNLVVVAGVDIDVAISDGEEVADLADVAAGFLNGNDVFNVASEPYSGFWLDVAAGAARNVVENDRDGDGFSDGLEMHLQTVLGGLVVVRGDEQNSVSAIGFSLLGEHDSGLGVVGTGTSDDRYAMVDMVDGVGDDLGMFFFRKGGRFASGAADDDGVGAIVDLEVEETFQCWVVDSTISGERGNDCAACASKDRHIFFLLKCVRGEVCP